MSGYRPSKAQNTRDQHTYSSTEKNKNPRQPPLPRWERRLPGVCSFSNKLLQLLIFHSTLATQTVLIDFEERVVNEDTKDYQSKIEENVSEVHRG